MLTSTTHKGFLPSGNNQKGFTLIEVLISMVILSVGIFGLIKTASSVIFFQKHSSNVTEATLKTANKIEEVKRLSANEPTGGAFGFTYLTSTYLTDEGFTEVDNQTYSKSETDGDFTQTLVLQVYPSGTTETFDEPTGIHMLEVLVTTQWTDSRGSGREVEMAAVIHRRQFIE
ncbi:MAG: prepilin-type N-terminal cleavage/methylation domain-containing protein [Nitrospina sp.]|nr:prepilin-type N-terminal cleavage/methylation domain-containing protein [Nitrospina sp.]MBT5632053.1 prepilin-type N-terminal cleavage/methylation domain-containing protein [Nitrospina sp.]